MVKRLVVVLMLMVVVFFGCGKDESGKPKDISLVGQAEKESSLKKKKEVQSSVVVEDVKEAIVKEKPFVSIDPEGKRIDWKRDGAKMVLISEFSVHDPFYMDVYEVTVGQYKQFVNATGHGPLSDISKYSPADNYPVVSVNWNDAKAYCDWAGKRLPTEVEWEYAARGGLLGKQYPWGDNIMRDLANYKGIGGKDKWEYCAPVGSFNPNGYGLYDMAGNVGEWCQDRSSRRENIRVLRGGTWTNSKSNLRVSNHGNSDPNARSPSIGFRCVADAQ